ncbi:MAG: hypothetical protein K9K81_10735, partial [Desulfobacteraceae bacterium]|nr:hypothetical protein [Desulfobacteraceae bacterium]
KFSWFPPDGHYRNSCAFWKETGMEIISSHLKITLNIAGISEKSNYIRKSGKNYFLLDFHVYVDVDFFRENR